MQKAADEAHGWLRELKTTYGRPTAQPWSPEQTETYEKAWQDWWNPAPGTRTGASIRCRAAAPYPPRGPSKGRGS
ncbi:hypothetical protein SNL152K_6561 [Streptomyces sp. NL15-2K]|nr:hypothetical protein SNL152K_6561 [Streptomyces sp. NL15-2K]